jgi:uncharacterized protein (TIGR03790 family)
LLLCVLGLAIGSPARAALEPAQVLVLINKDTDISSKVARAYQKLRAIPSENVLRLSLGTAQQITPEQYWTQAGTPIKQYLESHPAIRCVLTTSGVGPEKPDKAQPGTWRGPRQGGSARILLNEHASWMLMTRDPTLDNDGAGAGVKDLGAARSQSRRSARAGPL